MSRIVALGQKPFVLALTGAGVESVVCESAEDFERELQRLTADRDVSLVFAPEDYQASEAVHDFRDQSQAALLLLPSAASEQHPGLDQMRRLVERSTGAGLI